MTSQDDLAHRIVERLEESTQQLGSAQRERLNEARLAALATYSAEPAPAWTLAWAEKFAGVTEHRVLGVRYLIPVAALLLGLASVVYVNSNGASSDIADIDAGLLTDELPINAYLDKGFDSWLKRLSR